MRAGWLSDIRKAGRVSRRACVAAGRTLGLCLGLCALCAAAQDGQEAPRPDGHEYTLHVYQDLVQIPALVLTPLHASYSGLNSQDFNLSLDSGPMFHPRHARVEGQDPITLSILLDDSQTRSADLLNGLQAAISGLPQDLLTSRDHVSIYTFDCNLQRTTADQPASVAVMTSGVTTAQQSARVHNDLSGKPRCGKPYHLWDAVAMVTDRMHELPGRRIMIVIASGQDSGSSNSWEMVRQFASGRGVAVFGLRPNVVPMPTTAFHNMRSAPSVFNAEDIFGMLCGGTGGLALEASQNTLGPQIRRVVDYVRNRYILEFRRPVNGTAGLHLIDVAIRDKQALIRTGGVIFPMQDKGVLADPNTVPTNSQEAPVIGNRKVITPK